MLSSFKRPEDPNFPVVHYKFVAKSLNGDKLIEYRVQDLPPEYDGKAIDFMVKYFLPDEPFQLAASQEIRDGTAGRLRNFQGNVVKSRVSLVCFEEGSDEIVGLNVLKVETKDQVENENLSKIPRTLAHIGAKFDVFEHYQVDHYLNGIGLCVNNAYRGRGIATALLKARIPLLRCLNLEVTSTIFTSVLSQKAAASAGYEEKYSVNYSEIQERFPVFNFSQVVTPACKIFALKI